MVARTDTRIRVEGRCPVVDVAGLCACSEPQHGIDIRFTLGTRQGLPIQALYESRCEVFCEGRLLSIWVPPERTLLVFPPNNIGLQYLAEEFGRNVLAEVKTRLARKLGCSKLQNILSNTAYVSGTHVMLDSNFCAEFEKKLRQLVVEAVAQKKMVSGGDSVFDIVCKLYGKAAEEYYTTKVVGFGSEVDKQMLTIVLQETVEDTVESVQLEDGVTLDAVVGNAVTEDLLKQLSSQYSGVPALTVQGAIAVVKDGAIELMAEKAARQYILAKQKHNALDLDTSLSKFWSGGDYADKYLSLAKQRATDLDVFLGIDHVKWLEKEKHPNAADSSQGMVPAKLLQDTVIGLAQQHGNELLAKDELDKETLLTTIKQASEERQAKDKQVSEDRQAKDKQVSEYRQAKDKLDKEERLESNKQNSDERLALLQAALSPSNRAPPHHFSLPAQMQQQQPSASMVLGGGAVQQFSQGSFGGGGGFSTAPPMPSSGNSVSRGAVQQFSQGSFGGGGGFSTAPPTPPSNNSVFGAAGGGFPTAQPPSSSSNSISGCAVQQFSQGTGGAGGGFPTAQPPPASSNSGFGGAVQMPSPQGNFPQSSSSNPFAGSSAQSGFGATAQQQQQQQQQSGGFAFTGSALSSPATPPVFGASATTQTTLPQQQQQQSGGVAFTGSALSSQATPPVFGASATTQTTLPQQQQQQSGGVAFTGSALSSQATPPVFGASATTQTTLPSSSSSSSSSSQEELLSLDLLYHRRRHRRSLELLPRHRLLYPSSSSSSSSSSQEELLSLDLLYHRRRHRRSLELLPCHSLLYPSSSSSSSSSRHQLTTKKWKRSRKS